jgi:6-phosphofructokinase 1
MRKYNVLVGQSGGPTPVINTSLLGLVEQALRKESIETIYGTAFGVEGILNGKLIKLNDKLPALRKAAKQPGAILGTSR